MKHIVLWQNGHELHELLFAVDHDLAPLRIDDAVAEDTIRRDSPVFRRRFPDSIVGQTNFEYDFESCLCVDAGDAALRNLCVIIKRHLRATNGIEVARGDDTGFCQDVAKLSLSGKNPERRSNGPTGRCQAGA
jgi:hypothetical protein